VPICLCLSRELSVLQIVQYENFSNLFLLAHTCDQFNKIIIYCRISETNLEYHYNKIFSYRSSYSLLCSHVNSVLKQSSHSSNNLELNIKGKEMLKSES